MEDLFQVGIITGTHGLKGEVKVFPTTDDKERFLDLDTVLIDTGKELIEKKVQYCKFFKQFVFVKFEGLDDINDVEKYKRCPLKVTRENAVPLEEDEYYVADLLGLTIVDESGVNIGEHIDAQSKALHAGIDKGVNGKGNALEGEAEITHAAQVDAQQHEFAEFILLIIAAHIPDGLINAEVQQRGGDKPDEHGNDEAGEEQREQQRDRASSKRLDAKQLAHQHIDHAGFLERHAQRRYKDQLGDGRTAHPTGNSGGGCQKAAVYHGDNTQDSSQGGLGSEYCKQNNADKYAQGIGADLCNHGERAQNPAEKEHKEERDQNDRPFTLLDS